MSTAIDTVPTAVTDAGRTFNYANWSPGTVLTLVNVPWNNDYRDIVRFSSRTALDSWIDGEPNVTINRASLNRFQSNVRVNLPLNAAGRYNYLRAENPLMPVDGDVARNYYYFITGVTMLAPNTTELTVQLDVWQTFGYDVTFGSAFVERGHIGIANTKAFDHYGRDYLDEPEGLDVGGEYRTIHVSSRNIIDPSLADVGQGYSVLVCSTIDLKQDPGTYGTADNPSILSATGTIFQNMPSGAQFFLFKNGLEFLVWLGNMSAKPWVTQGIVSVTLVPSPTRYYPGWTWENQAPSGQAFYKVPHDAPTPMVTAVSSDWRNGSFLTNVLGSRYAGLKKFLTAPYLIVELTTFTGSPVVLKPQHWQDADATVREMVAMVPPGQRIVIAPSKYNADAETGATNNPANQMPNDDAGEYLNLACTISDFPQLPIVNNSAIAYLAQNRNSLAFQFRTADWSQQRALQGAGTAYGQAERGINSQNQLTRIGQNETTALAQQAAIATGLHGANNAAGSMVGGVAAGAGSAAHGNLVGGGASVVEGALGAGVIANNAAISAGQGLAAAGTQNQAAGLANRVRTGQAQYNADTNLAMASFAARGDYANAVAGVHAKIQDAAMIQPSTSGQFGGDAFNLINGNVGYSLRFKMLGPKQMRAIGDYWLRYGYAVHQFATLPSNLMCMTRFTYWKLTETYISQGAFPEAFKQILRGIFEKGVTVWANPDDIGTVDWSDNHPLSGITLP